jgi:hypothetical protein
LKLSSLLALCLLASVASAQPAPAGDKMDAKTLMASGLKLYGQKV